MLYGDGRITYVFNITHVDAEYLLTSTYVATLKSARCNFATRIYKKNFPYIQFSPAPPDCFTWR